MGNWNLSNSTAATNMFRNTTKLKYLDFSANLSNLTTVTGMFTNSMGSADDTVYLKTPKYIKEGTTITLPDTFVIELPEYCIGSNGSCGGPDDYPWVSTLTYYSPREVWIRNEW